MSKSLSISHIVGVLVLAASCAAADAQPTNLYRAGPTADSSFLRFVNGAGGDVSASSAAGTVTLTAQQPSTAFSPVQSKWPVKGMLAKDGKQVPINLQLQPSEFVTVVALTGPDGLTSHVVREQPDDFNALKTSLAFANLASQTCAAAGLKVAGRETFLFDKVTSAEPQRRLLNPVKLSVQLTCANKSIGAPLALGQLEAGERYSVLVVPDATGARLLFTHDTLVP